MAKNSGKVGEKSGNFVSPEKWEPCHWNQFSLVVGDNDSDDHDNTLYKTSRVHVVCLVGT